MLNMIFCWPTRVIVLCPKVVDAPAFQVPIHSSLIFGDFSLPPKLIPGGCPNFLGIVVCDCLTEPFKKCQISFLIGKASSLYGALPLLASHVQLGHAATFGNPIGRFRAFYV